MNILPAAKGAITTPGFFGQVAEVKTVPCLNEMTLDSGMTIPAPGDIRTLANLVCRTK